MAGKRKVATGSGKRPSKKARVPFAPLVLPAEHLKITRNLLPLIRAERAPTKSDFEEVGAHLRPTRDYRTVKRIYEKYVKGEPWSKRGPAPKAKHEPIRVNMELQKLLAKEPKLTLAQCAFQLNIEPPTFYTIYKKVVAVPPERTDYSHNNPKFCPDYMYQFQLPLHTLRIEAFSITDLGVLGRLVVLLELGVEITLMLDWRQTMATFELPIVKTLLAKKKEGAKIRILVPKECSRVQHIKLIIVDDVMSSNGSVNPSFTGLNLSYESITYHFMFDAVQRDLKESQAKEALFMEIDDEWIREQEKLTTAAKQLAAAQASEGFAPEELVSAGEEPVVDGLAPEELVLGEYVDEEGGAIIEEEKKEKARKAGKADYNRLKLAGLCVKCRAVAVAEGGSTMCTACRRKINRKRGFRYYLRQAEGRCTRCNKKKPASDKRSKCAACREKEAVKQNEAIRSREPGKCVTCRKRNCAEKPKEAGGGFYSKCGVCRKRAQESEKKRAAKRLELGLKREKTPGQCAHCSLPCSAKPESKGGGFYSECDWCRTRHRATRDFDASLGIKRRQPPRRPGVCRQCGKSAKAKEGGGFFCCCEECLEKARQRSKARYWKAQRVDEAPDEEEKEESADENEEKDGLVHF